jgi:hypothetical protein
MFAHRFWESVELAVPGTYAFAFLMDVSTAKEIDPAVIELVCEPYPLRVKETPSPRHSPCRVRARTRCVELESPRERPRSR